MIIRKSPRDMSEDERNAFIKAIVTLKNNMEQLADNTTIGRYDQHVAIHLGVTGRFRNGSPMNFNDLDGGHGGPGFLPWHREYLLRIEQDLQSASGNPNLSIPYWDWTDVTTTFDIIFTDEFLGQYDNSGQIEVTNAKFAINDQWKLDQRVAMPMIIDLVFDSNATVPTLGENLVRNFLARGNLPKKSTVEFVLEASNYAEFRERIEAGASPHPRTHNYMHGWVGGVMGSHASPYDPIFMLNHGFIDMLWALWQSLGHHGSVNYTTSSNPPYGHGLTDPMWPWDGSDNVTTIDRLEEVLPQFSPSDRREPNNVLSTKTLNYAYVSWSRVKSILDAAIESWSKERGGVSPRLTVIHGGSFYWNSRDELLQATARGRRLIERDKIGNDKGFDTNLIKALRFGFPEQDVRQMPAGGPHLSIMEIAEIAHWIDMGCPDDSGNTV